MAASAVTIACVGHTAWDRVFHIAALPQRLRSAKVPALAYRESGGGMAANAACAIAELGGGARFIGPAGDDEVAIAMERALLAAGVDPAGFHRVLKRQSSTSAVIVEADGERLIVNFRGDALQAAPTWVNSKLLANCQAVLGDVRWPQGVAKAFRLARAAGLPTILDADLAVAETYAELLPLTDHAIFSAAGAAAAFPGMPLKRLPGAVLQAMLSVKMVAITLGERGVMWQVRGTKPAHLPAFSVTAVDTTGAGDAFHGAYALALAEGCAVAAALRFASATAALQCTTVGARELPARTAVNRLLKGAT